MADPDENTLGADLLSDPKARVLRRRKVMENDNNTTGVNESYQLPIKIKNQ